MKRTFHIISLLAISALSIIACRNQVHEEAGQLPATNAERYPERFIGTEHGCDMFPCSYWDYLQTLGGKYSFSEDLLESCPTSYYDYLRTLRRDWSSDDLLREVGSPMRSALIEVLGYEKFALLYTYCQVTTPIKAADGWVMIEQMWTHAAYRHATILIDTENRLLYVQWINPDTGELLLYYELREGEEASPATILSRDIPESVREDLCYGLVPDLDPDVIGGTL